MRVEQHVVVHLQQGARVGAVGVLRGGEGFAPPGSVHAGARLVVFAQLLIQCLAGAQSTSGGAQEHSTLGERFRRRCG